MAILHIIATRLETPALAKLAARSHVDDAYVFMDDGVYVLLNKELSVFGARPILGLLEHVHERGLANFNTQPIRLIGMADLVGLTASYASSMSW